MAPLTRRDTHPGSLMVTDCLNMLTFVVHTWYNHEPMSIICFDSDGFASSTASFAPKSCQNAPAASSASPRPHQAQHKQRASIHRCCRSRRTLNHCQDTACVLSDTSATWCHMLAIVRASSIITPTANMQSSLLNGMNECMTQITPTANMQHGWPAAIIFRHLWRHSVSHTQVHTACANWQRPHAFACHCDTTRTTLAPCTAKCQHTVSCMAVQLSQPCLCTHTANIRIDHWQP